MRNLFHLVWVIFFLIKNKGQFEIDMQEPSFGNDYWVDKDNEDFYIKTSIQDLIDDIYECNK